MNEEQFKQIIAKNLTSYRKANNLTQLEFAEKFNYSDKAVSKWERGESTPDLFTLSKIASFYGITIDDLTKEDIEIQPKEKEKDETVASYKRKAHVMVTLLSSGLVWFVITLVFCVLKMILPTTPNLWVLFIIAIPVMFIVLVVFACIWGNILMQLFSISSLVWTLAIALSVCLAIPFPNNNPYLTYIVAIPFQVLVCLWFILVKFKIDHKKNGK